MNLSEKTELEQATEFVIAAQQAKAQECKERIAAVLKEFGMRYRTAPFYTADGRTDASLILEPDPNAA